MKRKGQEETMGFVIIILILVVVGVVFLGFALNKGAKDVDPHKKQVEDLMQSMLLFTTDCEVAGDTLNVRELIRECERIPDKDCANQVNVCDKRNEIMEDLLDNTLGQGIVAGVENAFIQGFTLDFNSSVYTVPSIIERGNLSGNYFSAYVPIPVGAYQEDVELSLKCYYAID
ncbi:MAG: hypothetical protein JSW08_02625 [archaeon]|nr:MAG: hypothetical protein JSW08_02625 [archaeon]